MVCISLLSSQVSYANIPTWNVKQNVVPDWHTSTKQPKKRSTAQYNKELYCLTKNIYHEAAYEPIKGRKAVALVTMNRLKNKNKFKKSSICGVVWAHKQFSWTLFPWTWKVTDKKAFMEAKQIAREVLRGNTYDFTNGATHYYNYNIVRPKWSSKGYDRKVIGNHVFMKIKS